MHIILGFLIYLLGRVKDLEEKVKSLIFIIRAASNIRSLRGRLCVTLLYEIKREEHGEKLYFSLCNGEWLNVVWILLFIFGVFYLECDKRKESSSYISSSVLLYISTLCCNL